MKLVITKPIEFNAKFLKIDANVRYWVDADINGEPDVDLDEHPEEMPRMPFSVYVEELGEWHWQPIIDLETHQIVGWPNGVSAETHYKVCDEGIYTVFDDDMNEIVSVESYVPDFIGEYGDYLTLNIDENGYVEDFVFGQYELDDLIENGF